MELTEAQQETLKTFIQADPTLGQLPQGNGSALQIANALNVAVTPTFQVWRSSVLWDTIMTNGMDWTRVDNLQNGNKWRIWEWMFKNSQNAIDPSKSNVRAGINASWVGTAQDLAVRAAIYGHCFRAASIAEKLLATGAGTSPAVDGSGPAVAGATGDLSYQEVNALMGWEF